METTIIAELQRTTLGQVQMEDTWTAFKESVVQACEQLLTTTNNQQKKKQWMTDEILEMMEDRLKVKTDNPIAYRQIHSAIKQKIREAKEKWMSE